MSPEPIEELERRVRESPEDAELRFRLAAALRDAGRPGEAAAACRQVLAREPQHAAAKGLLSELEPAEPSRPPGVPDSRSASSSSMTAMRTIRGKPPPAPSQHWARDTLEQPTVIPLAEEDVESEQTDRAAESPRSEVDPREEVTGGAAPLPQNESTAPSADAEPPGTRRGVGFVGGPSAEEDDPLELVRAFDRPFAEALSVLRREGEGTSAGAQVFPELPDRALAEMARGMSQREFQKGELILREGEPGDACFVIVGGGVRILKRDPLHPRGDLVEVSRLGDGALFGEFALLADRRRHATVQATEACTCYEIPRRLLRRLAESYPEITPVLERFYRERLLATLLATAPFFKPLEPERRSELLTWFQPRRVESGERIVQEGERACGFYLIVLGSVEITKQVAPDEVALLATLGEGAYFGEMSLLRGDVARASVSATGPVELALLQPKDFYTLVANHPVLWEHIRQEAHRREHELYELVTGVTGSS